MKCFRCGKEIKTKDSEAFIRGHHVHLGCDVRAINSLWNGKGSNIKKKKSK